MPESNTWSRVPVDTSRLARVASVLNGGGATGTLAGFLLPPPHAASTSEEKMIAVVTREGLFMAFNRWQRTFFPPGTTLMRNRDLFA